MYLLFMTLLCCGAESPDGYPCKMEKGTNGPCSPYLYSCVEVQKGGRYTIDPSGCVNDV